MPAPATHDAYLASMTAEHRKLLEAFRIRLAAMLPDAEEVIAYAMPVYRLAGKVAAGYAGWVKHCSFYPHSGNIIPLFMDEIKALGFGHTKSAVHFTATKPIPDDLPTRMLAARRMEIFKP